MADTRSHARITRVDLKRLVRLAQEERDDFFTRHPEWAILYRKRILCAALCGDSALHYLNGITGVSEFQVWTFYAENSEASFPPHHVSHLDYGESKFGRNAALPESYKGRRVELQGRSLDARPDEDPLEALQRYLKARGIALCTRTGEQGGGAAGAGRVLRRRSVALAGAAARR